jgi:hypothetical protein
MDSQELRALVRPLALASAPKCGESSGKPVSCPNLKVKREAGIDTLTLAGPPRVRKPSTKASESASPCWSGAKAGVDVGVGWDQFFKPTFFGGGETPGTPIEGMRRIGGGGGGGGGGGANMSPKGSATDDDGRPRKRQRKTPEQLAVLTQSLNYNFLNCAPRGEALIELSVATGLEPRQITSWFSDQRRRHSETKPERSDSITSTGSDENDAQPFAGVTKFEGAGSDADDAQSFAGIQIEGAKFDRREFVGGGRRPLEVFPREWSAGGGVKLQLGQMDAEFQHLITVLARYPEGEEETEPLPTDYSTDSSGYSTEYDVLPDVSDGKSLTGLMPIIITSM